MDLPQLENAVKAEVAEPAKILAAAEKYETDLISFVVAHKGLAAQFAFVVAIPVAFLAFALGKHFHS
jgi:hypothetical protein